MLALSAERQAALHRLLERLQHGLVSGGDAHEMFDLVHGVLDVRGFALTQHFNYNDWHFSHEVPESWLECHRARGDADPAAAVAERPPGSVFLVDADFLSRLDPSRPNPVEPLRCGFLEADLGTSEAAW